MEDTPVGLSGMAADSVDMIARQVGMVVELEGMVNGPK